MKLLTCLSGTPGAGEVNSLVQGHTAKKQRRWNLHLLVELQNLYSESVSLKDQELGLFGLRKMHPLLQLCSRWFSDSPLVAFSSVYSTLIFSPSQPLPPLPLLLPPNYYSTVGTKQSLEPYF